MQFKSLGSVRCFKKIYYAHQVSIYLIKNTECTVHRADSKWKWSSPSPCSGDFEVNRARVCNYFVVWNALDKGSDLISSSSSAGMFPWCSTVCVSRCRCFHVICLFIVVSITVANKHNFFYFNTFLMFFCYIIQVHLNKLECHGNVHLFQ